MAKKPLDPPMCRGCRKYILQDFYKNIRGFWHRSCFVENFKNTHKHS